MKLWDYLQEEEREERQSQLPQGLTSAEAARRRKTVGKNQLTGGERVRPFQIFLCQFKDFLTLVLLGGTVVSVLTGEYAEALTIAVIILLNGLLGFLQEYRTERTLEALRQMAAPKARVWRDGTLTAQPAEELVPGDLVALEAGDRVPADGVLLESASLGADESMLTGESVAVPKEAFSQDPASGACPPPYEIPDIHRIWMGTTVVAGRGLFRVTAIGMETQMGRIAGMIQDIPR